MTVVKTNINHNIDEADFKHTIATTASLIRYQGNEYLEKLKALNAQYEITGANTITEQELHLKQVGKC